MTSIKQAKAHIEPTKKKKLKNLIANLITLLLLMLLFLY
jgi:hypothetical protein